MQDVNVVIIFYSRTGTTEKIALAAAVGAVEGRANIRLRRIAETAHSETIAATPEWKENHDRMSWEYIAPREADTQWAEGLVLVIPGWMNASTAEVQSCLSLCAATGGKVAVALGPSGLREALAAAGFTVYPTPESEDALECGRLSGLRVAEAARAEKQK
jgi:hypothetical protein